MYLNRKMERMLEGEEGTGNQIAMRTLVALGEAYGAEKMVKIKSAHVSGASYDTVGEHGMDLIKNLSEDSRVTVKTTLNPIGFDRDLPDMVSKDFYEKQMQLLELFRRMGVELTCTCTPYYGDNVPSFGDIVAWAESSAIVYINSLIGARTNRESGFSALCAAIVGYTPYHSLLMDENRVPNFVVRVAGKPNPGRLGLYIGKEFTGIPYFIFDRKVDETYLKLTGAAMGASGNISMFHVDGITPEYVKYDVERLPKIDVDENTLKDYFDNSSEFEAVVVGCPHLSEKEIRNIVEFIRERDVVKPIYLYTSRSVLNSLHDEIKFLKKKGVKILVDTCMVVSPILRGKYRKLGTNSGKAYNYLRSRKFGGFEVYLAPMEELLYASTR